MSTTKSFVVLSATLLLLAATHVQAWWCTGHMIVGHVAWDQLSSSTQQKIAPIITNLFNAGPFPMIPDMVQATCWADDIKTNIDSMESWHFINLPYNPDGTPVPGDVIQKENVEEVIEQMSRSVHYPGNNWEMSFALANLIHFYGDIHQPFHDTELFSSAFPNGDEGALLFKVYVDGTEWALHFVWDSVCTKWASDPTRPLNSSAKDFIATEAKFIEANYEPSAANKSVWNTTIMAQESYSIAVGYGYAGLTPGQTLTSEYLKGCLPIVYSRLGLAGYRLASELEYVFGSSDHKDMPDQELAALINERVRLAKLELDGVKADRRAEARANIFGK